jgi:transcriptional regulator with XRE-family HTH domain
MGGVRGPGRPGVDEVIPKGVAGGLRASRCRSRQTSPRGRRDGRKSSNARMSGPCGFGGQVVRKHAAHRGRRPPCKDLPGGVAVGGSLISECARMRVPTGRLRIVSAPQQGEAADTHEGPPSPGRYIRDQRQRRGMSVEQLAIDTKIPRASIDALEEDHFSALPGPVFVKGFFRCCARSLGIDAEVVLSLLHDRERALQQLKVGGRRESAVAAVAAVDRPELRRIRRRDRVRRARPGHPAAFGRRARPLRRDARGPR